MERKKPQQEQVVIDLEREWESEPPMPAITEAETARESSASAPPTNGDQTVGEVNASPQPNQDDSISGEDLSPGTIQACYRPGPKTQNRPRQSPPPRKQYAI